MVWQGVLWGLSGGMGLLGGYGFEDRMALLRGRRGYTGGGWGCWTWGGGPRCGQGLFSGKASL